MTMLALHSVGGVVYIRRSAIIAIAEASEKDNPKIKTHVYVEGFQEHFLITEPVSNVIALYDLAKDA